MGRLRFYDCRVSRLPQAVGLCQGDTNRLAQYFNSAQSRLVMCREAGEEGWYGGWAEVQFTLSQSTPYITFGPDVARLELVDLCNSPIQVNNQFTEYLRYGNGRLPKQFQSCHRGCWTPQAYTRNNSATFTDLTNAPQAVAVYPGSDADVGKRVLLQGLDNNGNTIYSQDGASQITGIFVTLAQPFVLAPMQFNSITGIQKDLTEATVTFFQIDPTSGAQVQLLVMQPWETTAWYRRYYFNNLPQTCCGPINNPSQPRVVTLTGIVKLELTPLASDTDYLLIQNLEAMIEECQSVRYSTMDTPNAKQMELLKHKNAVGLLNGEINHYLGSESPAVNLSVFGSARLQKQAIGTLI